MKSARVAALILSCLPLGCGGGSGDSGGPGSPPFNAVVSMNANLSASEKTAYSALIEGIASIGH